MAYIKNLQDEQRNQPLTTSGQSTVISTGQGQDPNATAAQGTSWTNPRQYFDNNQGLGAGVGNEVTKEGQSQIESAAGKINEYETKGKKVDQTQANNLGALKSQILADPTKVDAKAYKDQTSAGYAGNTDAYKVDGYTDANSAFGKAKDTYSNLASDDWSNRSSAVQDTYGKNNPAYTKGMGMLDTFILQGDQSGKDALKGFQDKNASMFAAGQDRLSNARAGVQSTLDSEKNRWSTLLGETKQAVTEKTSSINQGIDQRFAAPPTNKADVSRLNSRLDSYLNDTGPDGTKGFYKMSDYLQTERPNEEIQAFRDGLGKYVTANKNYDRTDVMNDAEVQALNALAGLSGGSQVSKGSDNAFITNDKQMQDDWQSFLDKYWGRK